MTLVEVMLYLGIFSIIFSGFMVFSFQFSRSISNSISRQEGERVGMIIGEFVRWKVHHAESVVVSTSSLELINGDVHQVLKGKDVDRLFRFDLYMKPVSLSFHLERELVVSFVLNRKGYEVRVGLL